MWPYPCALECASFQKKEALNKIPEISPRLVGGQHGLFTFESWDKREWAVLQALYFAGFLVDAQGIEPWTSPV